MSRPSILTLQQKISGHMVSMSRHSALCHDSGVRWCFTNKTKLATIESSVAHDKAGRAKASAHDNVAPCCVATEEAMRARQRCACNKGILS